MALLLEFRILPVGAAYNNQAALRKLACVRLLKARIQPPRLHFFLPDGISPMHSKRKEGRVQNYYFRFNRQRGPVNALQMRLQG
jgi:hypothetical protein